MLSSPSRRGFLIGGGITLSLGALSGGIALVLADGTEATPGSGTLGDYEKVLAADPQPVVPAFNGKWVATEKNIPGPYYRKGAPFRGKVTPPLAAGDTLLVKGRVWGLDTRNPIANAVLDVWQANHEGHYDNEDDAHPPAADSFDYRLRLITDESGYYEYETIHPGRYETGPGIWRPAHIHYMVAAPKYVTLVTQMYFDGDPHNKTDQFIRDSLIMKVNKVTKGKSSYELINFDIVLAPKP